MTSQLPNFWCLFAAGSLEKDTENRAAVTSLRSFLFCDDFRDQENVCKILAFYIKFAGHFYYDHSFMYK